QQGEVGQPGADDQHRHGVGEAPEEAAAPEGVVPDVPGAVGQRVDEADEDLARQAEAGVGEKRQGGPEHERGQQRLVPRPGGAARAEEGGRLAGGGGCGRHGPKLPAGGRGVHVRGRIAGLPPASSLAPGRDGAGPPGTAQRARPAATAAAAATEPSSTAAFNAATSGARNLSPSSGGTSSRTRAWAAAAPTPGRSGARRSSACAAAISSTATTVAALSTTSRSLRAACAPIETWSSWFALVGMVSTEAGWASTLFSLTNAAAVYWATIRPEFRPPSRVRKAGRPESAGFTSCSTLRSLTLASSATAIAA